MVGSAIVRLLKKNLIKSNFKTKKQLDLLDQSKTFTLKKNKPDVVIICSAKVGV